MLGAEVLSREMLLSEKATQCVAFYVFDFFGTFGRSESNPPGVILERLAGLEREISEGRKELERMLG